MPNVEDEVSIGGETAEIRPAMLPGDTGVRGEVGGTWAVEANHVAVREPVAPFTTRKEPDRDVQPRETDDDESGSAPRALSPVKTGGAADAAPLGHTSEGGLQEVAEMLVATLDCIRDAVIVASVEGEITFINARAERLTGWSRQEALGTALADVFSVLDGETRMPVEGLLSSLPPSDGAARLKRGTLLVTRDGAHTSIEGSCSAVQNGQGDVTGKVLAFRDSGEGERQYEALRQHAGSLEQRLEELDTFARVMAHDIKGLVAHIVGHAHVLDEYWPDLSSEERDGSLRIIARSGRRVSHVIDELLLLATTRQVGEAQTTPLDMARVVGEAQHRLGYLVEEYQGEIVLPKSWPRAMGYAPWVEEVWVNYISNALKYGGQPPRVELGSTEGDDGVVRFWVRDNGPGVAPEQQAQLFASTTRLGRAGSKGHGLGLSIVRRIVELMGGQAAVESELGRGSVFSFTLPRAGVETGIRGAPDTTGVARSAPGP
jgi:PAS domain S-box-containing protein